jgi:shikimate kinase
MCIYLRAETETLYQRLIKSRKSRPLVEKEDDNELRNKIVNLWKIREEGYVQSASVTIDVDNLSVKEILIKILSLI